MINLREGKAMKKALLIVSMCLMFGTMGGRAEESAKKDVSVYRVPWVCPAAAQIGCGSHAKPILLELEQNLAWMTAPRNPRQIRKLS